MTNPFSNTPDNELNTIDLMSKYEIIYKNEKYYWKDNEYESYLEPLQIAQGTQTKFVPPSCNTKEQEQERIAAKKTFKYFLILVAVSIIIIISPIISAFYYYLLDYFNIMPLPDGLGALSFLMLFTIPGGIIFFIIGTVILFLLNLRRKSLINIEKHLKTIEDDGKHT